MNRINSPLFPDTLEEVVYQPRAFTCVEDGQINLDPDQESYMAALDALRGIDPTNGCLFYYNPKTATSRWMHSRPSEYRETIGNHVFMK
ncbi:MAG: cell wall hydrolase [Clostridiales bacterium]|jgi:N-acetylmuramoyl-L-alanine amidase|nr:cell wall hydrolase [Clostridiales bacterium]